MNDADRLKQIHVDRQRGIRAVIYLEGVTDPELFFALLGIPRPASSIHDGVYVVGLKSGGSGAKGVKAYIRVAQAEALSDVFGIIDGDGRDLVTLAAEFDAPCPGPLFSWKSYCIENLAAKAAVPASWGGLPDLRIYAPYVAFNHVQRELHQALRHAKFTAHEAPKANQSLADKAALRGLFAKKQRGVATVNTHTKYDQEFKLYEAAVSKGTDQAHALLNGKWLVEHHGCEVTKHSKAECRAELAKAVQAAGGLAEVRAWWRRVTGNAP